MHFGLIVLSPVGEHRDARPGSVRHRDIVPGYLGLTHYVVILTDKVRVR